MGCRVLYAMPPANMLAAILSPHPVLQALELLKSVFSRLSTGCSLLVWGPGHWELLGVLVLFTVTPPTIQLPALPNKLSQGRPLAQLRTAWPVIYWGTQSILHPVPMVSSGDLSQKNLGRSRSFCFLTLPTQVLPRSGSPSSIFHNSPCSFLHV